MSGSLLNIPPLTDGPVHTAADHNNPNASIAAIINGGIGTVNIVPGGLDDSVLTAAVSPIVRFRQTGANFVYSNLTIATSGTLVSTIIGGVAYINGKQVTLTNTSITVVLSKDTYVDVKDDGTVVQVPVANGATSGMPITTNADGSNALRIAKVVSSASAITSVVQTGWDPLGNAIYCQDPTAKTLGYTQITASQSGISTIVDLTNLSVTVMIPAGGRRIKITGYFPGITSTVTTDRADSSIREASTTLNSAFATTGGSGWSGIVITKVDATAGSHTYKLSLARGTGTGTLTLYSDGSLAQAFILVELA